MSTGSWRIDDGTTEIRRLSNALRAYFRRRIPEHEDPLDYVNSVWLAAGNGFRAEGRLRNYLFQIARRLVAERLRRASRRPNLIQLTDEILENLAFEGPGCDTALRFYRGHEELMQALTTVDPIYREATRLWLDGTSMLQIAHELGLHYHTARSRVARGRAQLQLHLPPRRE